MDRKIRPERRTGDDGMVSYDLGERFVLEIVLYPYSGVACSAGFGHKLLRSDEADELAVYKDTTCTIAFSP